MASDRGFRAEPFGLSGFFRIWGLGHVGIHAVRSFRCAGCRVLLRRL